MNKILRTILIISITVFSAGFLLVNPVQANDSGLTVQICTTPDDITTCKTLDETSHFPLFEETNFLPGQSITRWAKVTNSSGQPQRIATEAINYPKPIPDYDLSRALMIVIKEGATDLYGGSNPTTGPRSLYDFYQDSETYSEIYLSDLENGKTAQYDFTISFPSEKENEWQGAATTFNILIGFQGTAGQMPPGWGGGGVLPPGLTIRYEKDIYLTVTTATIEWETNYDSTSQVIYDTLPGKFNLNPATGGGPPNYGYTFSKEGDDIYGSGKGTNHRVTLTDLSAKATYYYRCVSHGSLAVSTEHSFTTLSVIGEEEEEEEEGVGEQEEEEEEEKEEPAQISEEIEAGKEEEEIVEGEEMGLGWLFAAIGNLFRLENLWWLLLLLIIIIIILFLLSRKKKRKKE